MTTAVAGPRARHAATVLVAMLAVTACSSSSKHTAPTTTPVATVNVTVRGTSTLDGKPFDSKWVGAVVIRGGLVTPCQTSLPPVTQGRYEVTVYGASQSSGCGAPGAKLALWIFANNKTIYSTNTVAWPTNASEASFTPQYSSAQPSGAPTELAQFTGGVYDANDQELPAGTRVEAYVGTTRCGVASVRKTSDYTGYVLAVVGPDSIPNCTRGARISFRVDGRAATSLKVVNTPPGQREAVDLIATSASR